MSEIILTRLQRETLELLAAQGPLMPHDSDELFKPGSKASLDSLVAHSLAAKQDDGTYALSYYGKAFMKAEK